MELIEFPILSTKWWVGSQTKRILEKRTFSVINGDYLPLIIMFLNMAEEKIIARIKLEHIVLYGKCALPDNPKDLKLKTSMYSLGIQAIITESLWIDKRNCCFFGCDVYFCTCYPNQPFLSVLQNTKI